MSLYVGNEKITNVYTTLTTATGGNDRVITGSFTPASTSGSYIVEIPKMPRAVFVKARDIGTGIDRYEPHTISIINPNTTMANGNSVFCSARYKSSTQSGTAYSQAGSYNAYTWSTSYTSQGASSYYYTVCVTSSAVYFKQSGNHRFRQGVTYDYYIVFDD